MAISRILVFSPLDRPSAALVRRLARTGALGIGVVRTDDDVRALEGVRRFGVYLRGDVRPPDAAEVVVVDAGGPIDDRTIVVVTDRQQAREAVAAGAIGLVAKGHEAGGQVSDTTTPILLQQLSRDVDVPVWAWGGIGVHTAAAAIQLGAAGVVLDSQVALYPEAGLSPDEREAIATMDGSETAVTDGFRHYDRPGPLREARIPIGQDGAFAGPFAKRYPQLIDVVRELAWEIDAHLGQAATTRPLAPGSPFARQHGLAYPIAQGPMTRVSDVAAFADAVAENGALPFLALSLVRGPSLDTMLEETAERLGDRPWGVGMLGFAPEEVRQAQLERVMKLKPDVALLAGGRPAQARALEAEGIPTYLHVPSPGLLDLFLQDGARRFVIEGRECGGHVGPRTSFVLWEQFVDRLLRFDALHEVSLLFAGGIHDGATGAMVSALAAPLALRGARIGVIMGTAYLFTEEAVSSGAVKKGFQEAALACEQTALVHTAPGHATRCVRSPFVDAFEAKRAELEAAGTEADAIWEELERLNLGRLRIASKGIVREGDTLVDVDEATQREQGMFMIGDVATLRDEVTTMAALHEEVCSGVVRQPEAELDGRPVEIAIVGMAGFFPGSPDIEAFWSLLVNGEDAVTEVPSQRWNVERYYDGEARGGEKSTSKWGGFLPPIPFDPMDYGIPPRSLAAIEPVQLLALEAARRALEDAGYGDGGFDRHRASVIFGAEAGTDLAHAYGFRALYPTYFGDMPAELDAVLPTLTEDSFPGVLANVIAGRIANRLDLGGVNYTVDAACASSIAALDLGVKELASHTSDLVLVGGADLHNTIADYLLFSSVQALSRTGRSRPFDGSADGIALGEGVGVIAAKRLEDAERDGDRIYAVIRAVAGSSDGKSLGLTAPRKEGQMRALRRAYQRSGVAPATVGLAEAHGTGTVVGDRTELQTLTEVFAGAGAPQGSVTLGSVKSNIGHTKCAAGLAGIIKVALALHKRVLPPTLHVQSPNPGWIREVSPFVFRSTPAPWPDAERVGGVSAFGFGGTNFHCVLAAHGKPARSGLRDWPAELFLFRSEDDVELTLRHLDAGARLVDLAHALAEREGPVKRVIVATDADDLRSQLERPALQDALQMGEAEGSVAFLFPGQGSQRPGMLADLFVAFPWLQDDLDPAWAKKIFPGDAYRPEDRKAQRAALTDTRVAQPALGIVEMAVVRLFRALGLAPAMAAGHSYGELVALTVAGGLPASDLTALSEARGRFMLEAADGDPGTMAAVKADEATVKSVLAELDDVGIANLNSPRQTVIAGGEDAITIAIRHFEERGIAARRIPVAAAFHSPRVAGAATALAAELRKVPIGPLVLPVYANVSAEPYHDDAIVDTLSRQLAEPVRFSATLRAMARDGAGVFVECGPGRVMTRLVEQTLGDDVLAIGLDDEQGGGALVGLVALLGRLAAAGVPFDASVLTRDRAGRLDLDAPPAADPPTLWYVDGQRAWPARGTLPAHAMTVMQEPLQVAGAGAREKVVLDYLETLRQQAEEQRRVMLAYLGDGPTDIPAAAATAAAPVLEAEVVSTSTDPATLLIEVVSERTGYPADMLDLDLDLEADLSIDSIKRIEILGVLGERMGVEAGEGGREELVEALSGVKTLRGMLDYLASDDDGPRFGRFVAASVDLPDPEGQLDGLQVALDVNGIVGPGLTAHLQAAGAQLVEADASVHLFEASEKARAGDAMALYDLGSRIAAAAARGERVVVWTDRSDGVLALVKTLQKELPEASLKCLVAQTPAPEVLAGELLTAGPVEVHHDGRRRGTQWVEAPLEPNAALQQGDLVLVTGGARGITARVAIEAARAGARVVLVGRSEAPEAEEPALAGLDRMGLRRHLAGQGLKPAEIERRIRRIEADRQMRDTFQAIGEVDYRAVDVRDTDAMGALLASLYERYGRIDWVIHGAGVNEDKLFRDKSAESFARVVETKVLGARALVEGLRDGVKGVVFFSSIAGAFGNRGQADYAAANATLDAIARARDGQGGTRWVSLGWGPWAGGGMVDEALERQYAKLGIGLIPPDEGVAACLAELGGSGGPHAVWMAARPEDLI